MEPKRLQRSRKDRMVAGVCGGLAQYFNVDVMLVRLAFLVMLIFGGSGGLLYIVMAVIMPEGSEADSAAAPVIIDPVTLADGTPGAAPASDQARSGPMLLGAILVVAGLAFLIQNLVGINFSRFWPLILIVIGAVLILPQLRGRSS